jgi:trehalose/maltose hydrolase-like predicted phosphorylase
MNSKTNLNIGHTSFREITAFALLGMLSTLPVSAQDAWTLKADHIDPRDYYGVSVANGMIGIVSSPNPFQVKEVLMAGAYDTYGKDHVSVLVPNFNLLDMELSIDGEQISSGNVSGLTQELNLRHAEFTTAFRYGDKAEISYSYCALRQLPHAMLMNVVITAKKDLTFDAANVMSASDCLHDIRNYFARVSKPRGDIRLLASTALSPTGKLLLAASTAFVFAGAPEREPAVLNETGFDGVQRMRFGLKLKAGESYHFSLVGTVTSSADNTDPLNSAERTSVYAALEGRDSLLARHEDAWDRLWKSDITIEGDRQTQQDVHSMLYHLYSFAREGSSLSISPMGLSGRGYSGHVFWDADLWMFPALLELHPEIAESLLEYRFQRLPAARQNALDHGYRGAMFPWESAASGDEDTPVAALSGPFEHHVTACVGLAAWNYFCVTQDREWLRQKGWPLLSATADFWVSRIERDGAGVVGIRNVVAADEYAENVDNDAFTNGAAKTLLKAAVEAAAILGRPENPDWSPVEKEIPILNFPNGVTREFAGYDGQAIKQADVNLLAYPLRLVTDPEAIRRDLAYYETRVPCEHTPAMTQSIFAILYERLGEPDKAFSIFKSGYLPNKRPPFGVLAETANSSNPYFATGAGGLVQSMLNGFGGLDITPAGLVQLPTRLPKGWKSLTLTGVGRGRRTFSVPGNDRTENAL